MIPASSGFFSYSSAYFEMARRNIWCPRSWSPVLDHGDLKGSLYPSTFHPSLVTDLALRSPWRSLMFHSPRSFKQLVSRSVRAIPFHPLSSLMLEHRLSVAASAVIVYDHCECLPSSCLPITLISSIVITVDQEVCFVPTLSQLLSHQW